MNQITELQDLIKKYASDYYNVGTSAISDEEYDALVAEYKQLGGKMEVGATVVAAGKIRHETPMLSLDKVTEVDKLACWTGVAALAQYAMPREVVSLQYSWKFDGLALELVYDNGVLVSAATRGDGEIGQDVTAKATKVIGIPARIPVLTRVRFRGEVVMPLAAFRQRFANAAGEKLTNPRNVAAGALLGDDTSAITVNELVFIVYQTFHNGDIPVVSSSGIFFAVKKHFNDMSLQQLIDERENARKTFGYPTDGLVFEKHTGEKIAFKFKPVSAKTKILSIDYQVGRTGKLTPVARLEPVLIDGSTVSNVNLASEQTIRAKGVYVGAEVTVHKAGDIIPEIIGVTERKDQLRETFMFCPSCGGVCSLDADSVSYWCSNVTCPAQLSRRILHWVQTINIMYLGPGGVDALTSRGLVKDVSDLYTLPAHLLISVFGGTVGQKLYTEIHAKKGVSHAVFLTALGIEALGIGRAKLILKRFSLEKLRQMAAAYCTATTTRDREALLDLAELRGIGTTTATSILLGIASAERVINNLMNAGFTFQSGGSGSLSGKTFCLTGEMSKPRNEIVKYIESNGGNVGNVSRSGVCYLVAADPNSDSDKCKKARGYGVPIITEAELYAMV